tara:strand:- start:296 stop:1867 length:1572 start_codon:yes stop_codon:yes gene_type:complete
MQDEIKYAGFWRRFFALVVDIICFYTLFLSFVLTLFLIGFIFVVQSGGLGVLMPEKFADLALASSKGLEYSAAFALPPLVELIIWIIYIIMIFGYFAGMESSSRQATYGKIMFGLKVTDEEGFKIGFWHACGRYLAKSLSFLTLFIGFLMAAFTEKKQALHDKVGKTLVIREGIISIWPPIKFILFSIISAIVIIFLLALSVRIVAGGNIYNNIEARQQFINKFFAYGRVDLSGAIDETKNLHNLLEQQQDLPNKDTCPNESFTNTPLEKKEDGLMYIVNKDSPYTGINCLYYDSGAKKEVSIIVEGRAHGAMTIWHENGNKKEYMNFEHGVPHGLYNTWYENGNKEKEVILVNNLFEGTYVIYHENGKPSETGAYVNSKLQGQVIFWDEKGNFIKSKIFEDNKVTQESTTPPDNLQEIINTLTADSQDNESLSIVKKPSGQENNNTQLKESWYENGQKKMERHYLSGKENGTSTLWYENGQKKVVINYKDGQRDGLLTRWHENGDVKITLTYSNGEIVKAEL